MEQSREVPPVFISYARKASREGAEQLHQALEKDGLAFLDSSDIELGERFPPTLVDALLASRVVVLFASEDYFRRWYCLWELETVLLGLETTAALKEAALASVVIVLPARGTPVPDLHALPPALREGNWPTADETGRIEGLVRARLSQVHTRLSERLEAAGQSVATLRTRLLDASDQSSPRNLADVRRTPRSLPPSLGESFVGRAYDLWRIHYALSVRQGRRGEGAAGAALTGALHGVGGFGKTRLALEYLHRFGPKHYPGGLFWVDAEVSPERLEEQFHDILRTLRPEVPDLVTFRERKRNAAHEMAEALEAVAVRDRVLYVVDNVPEPGPGERQKSLATWCPAIGKVSLLATSRARLDLGTEGVHALPVSHLSPDAAVALLMEGLGGDGLGEAEWRRIAEWVGYMPLALELLNRTLKAGGFEPRELLVRAQSHGTTRELDEQMEILNPHVPAGALRGVTEAFSISYTRLSPAEQKAARLIAQLAPEPIPMAVLDALGPEVVPPAVRVTLRARHFVTPVDAAGEALPLMFGSMHRVLADYLREQSLDPVAELNQMGQGLLSLMAPSACRDPKAWPLLKRCLPHAESVFDRVMKNPLRLSVNKAEALVELWLGLSLGIFLSARGLAKQAFEIDRRIVEHAMRSLGPDHPDTLTAMNNLAETLRAQGDLEGARAQQGRVLEVSRRVQGEEHPDTLTAMGNLAGTLCAQGDLEGARAQQERVLEVRRRVQGEEHPATLIAMNNLAGTQRAQGDLKGARAQQERVLEVRRRVLGQEHPATLIAMNNLAETQRAQGDLKGAREQQERVLEVMWRVLGQEHPDTLIAMNNLAATLWAQGDLAWAREQQERVLEVRRRVQGEEHPDTLMAMGNLAETLRAQGDLAWARAQQERVLEVSRRVLGQEHPDTLIAMGNLAGTLRAQGELEGARAQQERMLEVMRRVLGQEHPDTFIAMGNLAEMLRAQGNLEEARALQERVLEVIRRVLGEAHPHTLTAMNNLAVTLRQQGDTERASALEQEAQKIRQRSK